MVSVDPQKETSPDLENPPAATMRLRSAFRRTIRDFRLWIVLAVFVSIGALSVTELFLYTPDSARYLAWAESIASFKGFLDSTGPDPSRYVVHAPLYPIVLAPVMALFPGSVFAAKWLTLLLGGVLILLVFHWFSQEFSPPVALGALIAIALNPLLLIFSTEILSEAAFAATMVLVFLCTARVVAAPKPIPRSLWGLVAALAAALFLREAGLTLLLAVAVFFFLRKEYRRGTLILLVPVLLYLAWFVRNELLIADVENPAVRNTQIFTMHILTVPDASFLEELSGRLVANIASYKAVVGKLFFLAQFHGRRYDVAVLTDPPFSWFLDLPPVLAFLLIAVPVLLVLTGLVVSIRRTRSVDLPLLFILFYVPLVLFYPFNDTRFLFPLLPILVFYAGAGTSALLESIPVAWKKSRLLGFSLWSLFALCMVPHVLWSGVFMREAIRYNSSSASYLAEVAGKRKYAEYFLKPTELVGGWLRNHTDEDAVIASKWKELAFFAGGRKILEVNPLLPPDYLENQIRDYGVRYLVVFVDKTGIRELESQMRLSVRCRYQTVYRCGSLEVIEVVRRLRRGPDENEFRSGVEENEKGGITPLRAEQKEMRERFGQALRLLAGGQADSADSLYGEILRHGVQSPVVLFHSGLAKEFGMRLSGAEALFRQLGTMPQAGPFLVHAWYHLQLLSMIRQIASEREPAARSEIYTRLSFNYWDLGFRRQARDVLDRALEEDGGHTPALVFRLFRAIQEGSRQEAREYIEQLRKVEPFHRMLLPFRVILDYTDSLARSSLLTAQVSALYEIGDAYVALGMHDAALDEFRALVRLDPLNRRTWAKIGELCERKGLLAPSLLAYEEALKLEPENAELASKAEKLRERW